MTAVTAPGGSRLSPRPGSSRRRAKNVVATAMIAAAFFIACIPLVAVVWYVMSRGGAELSWAFITDPIPVSDRIVGPGMGPAVVGTLVITFGAAVMAIPLGILGAIYLNEYGKVNPLARVIRFMGEVMTGVPSIVMGLFVYTFWVLRFGSPSGFAGALALACLMLPIVLRTSEEMLRLVPDELREGSYALGSRKARTIRTVVLPKAAPGIVSGALLAVARAAGETAPLLFTIGIINFESNWNLFKGPNTTLSYQIFKNAASPFPAAQDRAWGAALTLILIVFVFTILARVATAVFARRQGA